MPPTPKKPSFSKVSTINSYASIFLFSTIFKLKTILLCENLVIKALTNLMAHFIFLSPNKLEPLCHLCCICLHLYIGISRTMLSRGAFSIFALVLCTQLISCSFVYGCRRCEIKRELVSPWSYVCVLEKCLGHRSNPCLIMVETCSVTIMSIYEASFL